MRLSPLCAQGAKSLRDLNKSASAPPCYRPGQAMYIIGHDRQSPIERGQMRWVAIADGQFGGGCTDRGGEDYRHGNLSFHPQGLSPACRWMDVALRQRPQSRRASIFPTTSTAVAANGAVCAKTGTAMMQNHRSIAKIILATAAFYPATPMAQVARPIRMTDLLVASAARLTRTTAPPMHEATPTLPLSNMFSPADRFDLAHVRSRTGRLSIGSAELSLSANRAKIGIESGSHGLNTDRWSTKGVGLSAAIPLMSDLGLIIGGDYARMSRRLQILDVNPHRLSTRMARAGVALVFGGESRLSLDYLSVARSSRHDELTRLAETIGGAPLTGNGLELALASPSFATRRGMDWRCSLGAMQRPAADLGLADQTALHSDRRAVASLRFHL